MYILRQARRQYTAIFAIQHAHHQYEETTRFIYKVLYLNDHHQSLHKWLSSSSRILTDPSANPHCLGCIILWFYAAVICTERPGWRAIQPIIGANTKTDKKSFIYPFTILAYNNHLDDEQAQIWMDIAHIRANQAEPPNNSQHNLKHFTYCVRSDWSLFCDYISQGRWLPGPTTQL